MLIESITLSDFRQFKGRQTLEFSTDAEKNVTVLLGDNTFGKTTILQAFNWCLYGTADFPRDSNPDFLLNLETATEMAGIQSKVEVSVELVLTHKDCEYIILRKEPYVDRGYNNWAHLNNTVAISYKENGITKQVREGEERNVINSILPQSLSGYFFFDTERVSDISSRSDLSNAVRGLLGLAAVGNARKHLGERSLARTAIGQWNAALDSSGDLRAQQAQNTIDKETDNIAQSKKEIADAEIEIEKLRAQKEKIEELLRANQSTADLQRKKQTLEHTLEQERVKLEASNKLFLEQYGALGLSYFMLPLMDESEQVLTNAKVDDRGIRDMTESSIRDIIRRGRCICGAPIIFDSDSNTGNEAYQHIIDELNYLPPAHIGTSIQNYKNLLANDRRSVKNYYATVENQYKEIQMHRDSISRMDSDISTIEKSIAGKENMSSYQADLDRIKTSMRSLNEKKARCNQAIGASESAIKSAQKTYDSLVSASEKNKKLITYIAYAEEICRWIDDTYMKKEQAMREQLQIRVNSIFSKMYHGQRQVQIDKQYHVTLLANVNGRDVVTGESEGLKRVKNFAFIAGLVDLAKEKATMGRNEEDSITWENEAYPLVMDAPFSNADETHIKNISGVLPSVANQVIMFVMEKDWQYAQTVMSARVGKYCNLKKVSESHTEIV